uniref:F-actin-capping protein subunit beta n=1 Tax=Haptolina brevifila TaxID=156173 RepID=A0A7S2FVW9_9EUKA|mmetsp:Transcript_20738/g.42148  ORF Transcript_20738/g.42148 Transcript_20738/m.42148 type:complete len:277 (+) Transcript_20738:64-894(+)
MPDSRLLASLDLMRRMPPSRMEASLEELVDLAPDLTDELLNTVDQPLQVAKDTQKNVYLLCDYNRDADSYRSPWTNTYDPPLEDGVLPPANLRTMEVEANEVFKSYMAAYYEGGGSSVYCWELDSPNNFAACILFKKDVDQKKRGLDSGGWDAIHVIEVRPAGTKATYKLTSTIMLRLSTDHSTGANGTGELKLSGSMTRQNTQEMAWDGKNMTSHLANMGRMVEEMENRMRDSLQDVYFGKTKSTVNSLYSLNAQMDQNKQALATALQQSLGSSR